VGRLSASLSTTIKKKEKHTFENGDEWGESQQKNDIISALDTDSGIHALSTAEIFNPYSADSWLKRTQQQIFVG
jgi:hypothetical protein